MILVIFYPFFAYLRVVKICPKSWVGELYVRDCNNKIQFLPDNSVNQNFGFWSEYRCFDRIAIFDQHFDLARFSILVSIFDHDFNFDHSFDVWPKFRFSTRIVNLKFRFSKICLKILGWYVIRPWLHQWYHGS